SVLSLSGFFCYLIQKVRLNCFFFYTNILGDFLRITNLQFMSLPIRKSAGFHFIKFFQCPEQPCGRILPATKNDYCFFHCTFLHSFYFRGTGFEPSAQYLSVTPDTNILVASTTQFILK